MYALVPIGKRRTVDKITAEVEKLLSDDSFRPFRTTLKRNGAAAPFRGCQGHSIAALALSAFPLQLYSVGDYLRIKKH